MGKSIGQLGLGAVLGIGGLMGVSWLSLGVESEVAAFRGPTTLILTTAVFVAGIVGISMVRRLVTIGAGSASAIAFAIGLVGTLGSPPPKVLWIAQLGQDPAPNVLMGALVAVALNRLIAARPDAPHPEMGAIDG